MSEERDEALGAAPEPKPELTNIPIEEKTEYLDVPWILCRGSGGNPQPIPLWKKIKDRWFPPEIQD